MPVYPFCYRISLMFRSILFRSVSVLLNCALQ